MTRVANKKTRTTKAETLAKTKPAGNVPSRIGGRPTVQASAFTRRLLDWYRSNKRSLPWRDHPDPYAVWVSEIMLQQTRVEAVIPYFKRWLEYFPTIEKLAQASEQSVLNAWEGLGYYARARNLRKAAQEVMSQHGGQLPGTVKALRGLPGIGQYTAGAIASMAFGLDEAALDGNIRRVLARVFNVGELATSPTGQRTLWALAEKHLLRGQAGDYNQAMMDLGATVCLPANPACPTCPVRAVCEARRLRIQSQRPVLAAKAKVPHYTLAAAVVLRGGRVLLSQRPADGLLGGMWEFPNARVSKAPPREIVAAIAAQYGLRVTCGELLAVVPHAYSHFSVEVYAYHCQATEVPKRDNLRWIALRQLADYPMGKIDRRIAKELA